MVDEQKAACVEWLIGFMREHKNVTEEAVYQTGAAQGFSRENVDAARKYLGKLITESWRWDGWL